MLRFSSVQCRRVMYHRGVFQEDLRRNMRHYSIITTTITTTGNGAKTTGVVADLALPRGGYRCISGLFHRPPRQREHNIIFVCLPLRIDTLPRTPTTGEGWQRAHTTCLCLIYAGYQGSYQHITTCRRERAVRFFGAIEIIDQMVKIVDAVEEAIT